MTDVVLVRWPQEVMLVRWPEEEDNIERLRTKGVPRLLLVAPGATPPTDSDCIQDWIRLPADDADIHIRAVVLARRAASHNTTVNVTDDGRVSYGGKWVGLSPLEQSLLRTLADSIGDVVSYDALVGSAWPDGNGSGPALRVHILRLRRRILPIGLEIRTVPKRGYVLEATV